jgi:hypothetical protein
VARFAPQNVGAADPSPACDKHKALVDQRVLLFDKKQSFPRFTDA